MTTTLVQATRTFPASGNLLEWINSRWSTARDVLTREGLPLEIAEYVARAFLMLWWLEIGPQRDKAEFNFNVGNIKCQGTPSATGPWKGYCMTLGGDQYRSYATLDDGISDFIRLMRGSKRADGTRTGLYVPALRYLVANPRDGLGWYRMIRMAGYSSMDPAAIADGLATYAGIDTILYNHAHAGQ